MGGRGSSSGLRGGAGGIAGGGGVGGVTGGGAGGVTGGGALGAHGGSAGGPAGGGGGGGPMPNGQAGTAVDTLTLDGTTVHHYVFQYGFNDGTRGGIFKTVDADVYELPNGVRIYFPKDYDKAKQDLTPEKVVKAYHGLPPELQRACPKKIEIVDYENPRDPYWRQRYTGFTKSAATGNEDGITVYGTGMAHSTSGLTRTISHETGHAIDNRLADRYGDWYSERAAWQKAMQLDQAHSGKESPTNYGTKHVKEDFAESIKIYVSDPTGFANNFPNRKDLLDAILATY